MLKTEEKHWNTIKLTFIYLAWYVVLTPHSFASWWITFISYWILTPLFQNLYHKNILQMNILNSIVFNIYFIYANTSKGIWLLILSWFNCNHKSMKWTWDPTTQLQWQLMKWEIFFWGWFQWFSSTPSSEMVLSLVSQNQRTVSNSISNTCGDLDLEL